MRVYVGRRSQVSFWRCFIAFEWGSLEKNHERDTWGGRCVKDERGGRREEEEVFITES